jgi:hypothetical protein
VKAAQEHYFCNFEACVREMRKFIPGYILFIAAGLLIHLGSCTPESCLDETEAYVKAYFFKGTKNVAADSLTIYGLGRDSSFYSRAKKVTSANLPLDALAESSSFVIKYNNIIDTLTIRYTTYTHLISKECGYTYYHTIEAPEFTTNGILSVTVKKNTITTANEQNILIYY